MLELLGIFWIPLLIANVVAFVHFRFTDAFKSFLSKGTLFHSPFELIYVILGVIGTLIAMLMQGERTTDMAYKIVVPIAVVIELGTVIYLILFDAGVVN